MNGQNFGADSQKREAVESHRCNAGRALGNGGRDSLHAAARLGECVYAALLDDAHEQRVPRIDEGLRAVALQLGR